MTDEEILRAIFEGPIGPLTQEEQAEKEERERRYQQKRVAKNLEYAGILGVSVERVEEMRKENLIGLIEMVVGKKLQYSVRALIDPR